MRYNSIDFNGLTLIGLNLYELTMIGYDLNKLICYVLD